MDKKQFLTNREEKAIIPGESKTLHCPPVVGYGISTSSFLDVPNADEALLLITAACC